MAEGGVKNVTCRYFLNGACKGKENCLFSHDRQNSRPSLVCQYYLKGACTYGTGCRFDHVRPEYSQPSSKNSASEAKSSTAVKQVKPIILNDKLDATKNNLSVIKKLPSIKDSKLNANALEFTPRNTLISKNTVTDDISFAQIVGTTTNEFESNQLQIKAESELCPFALLYGLCNNPECVYIHGDICVMCQLFCLNPNNVEQRSQHIQECTKLMEDEMEHSFAVAKSKEKHCGICMEKIMERNTLSTRRFGILPNCNHCFCLECLRKWRQSKNFENKIIRSCPECRVQSDYIIPSEYWCEEKDEKENLLKSYRQNLSLKKCKYFQEGQGECPFGNKCFYKHCLPDGTLKDVGPPKRRKRFNADGQAELFLDSTVLWEFIQESEEQLHDLRGRLDALGDMMALDLMVDELIDMFLSHGLNN